jgi:hypothetical protein
MLQVWCLRLLTFLLSPPRLPRRLPGFRVEKSRIVGDPGGSTAPPKHRPAFCLYAQVSEFDSMTKIYVGNLPFTAAEGDIRALFAQHGTVENVNVITDRETGRPRGFAFVEMSRADASRAIQNLNGKDMGGRPLRVNEAQERTGGGARSGGGGAPRRW